MKFLSDFRICFSLATLACILFACAPSSQNEKEEEVEEYPRISIDSLLGENPKLYELSEDFIEDFLQKFGNYEGTKVIMRAELPREWGLVGWEQLPEGQELWLVQSLSREWTCLVVTSGSSTQRIKDILPIGLDLATGGNDYNQRELWTWKREDDGFVVDKFYELKKDVRDTLLNNESSHVVDKYLINVAGYFEWVPVAADETDSYCAVVAYCDCLETPEGWEDLLMTIEPFCEENNLYFKSATCNFRHVTIEDYKMNDIVTKDISPYIREGEAGFVLFSNDSEPVTIPPASSDYIEMTINKFFKIK